MNPRGAAIIDGTTGRTWQTDAPLEDKQAVFEEMKGTLPGVKRRTPKERMEAIWLRTSKTTMEGMLKQLRLQGHAEWPRSVEDQLTELSRRDHDPKLASAPKSVEDIAYQARAFTRWLTESGEMQQKALDYKSVVRTWTGH